MSEVVDSGHKVPEKSNFSQTFNLLSQHLKENGSLEDLNLAMAARRKESGQLSIFYAGQVMVVDDFPADKAMEIMKLAGSGTQPPAAVCDLPMARKASLARFFEKRRERITARAAAYSKPEPHSN